jgi:cytoskeleton protein RodZ
MTLGDSIRDARVAAHLSIEDLSNLTSIRIGLLTEMENNNFSHCGGDTYARGHLRSIANKVGVDPNIFIVMFNGEHSTEGRAMQDLLIENNVISNEPEPKRVSWKVPAGVSVAVLLIIAVAQIIISNQDSSPKPQVSQQPATPTDSAIPSPTPSVTASPTSPAIPQPSPSATVKAPSGPVILTLVATRGNSYIDIIVDGKRTLKGSIFQGETKKFEGKKSISVYLSNPGGLDVTLNGKPVTNLGGENEEVRRTFR